MNTNQEIVQPSETSFHIRSAKFLCRPCNRQFSCVNPENNRAACPRCDRYSNVMLQDAQQSTIQPTDVNNQSTTSQQQSQPQQPQTRNMPFIRQTIYQPGQTIIIQTMIPEMQFNTQQTEQNTGFGFGNMFSGFANGLANLFGSASQQSNETRNPFDLFGEMFQQPQQQQSQQQQQGFSANPFNMFFMQSPMMFFNTSDYERVIQEFLRNDPNNYGPAPATEQNIKSLKEFDYRTGVCKNTDCSVCQDEYQAGDKCVALPCEHNYHKDCVVEWLNRHDSCPICRKSINPNKQGNTEKMEEEVAGLRRQTSC